MAQPVLNIIENGDEMQRRVIDLIDSIVSESIQHHGFFSIGVSGGSVAKILSQGFREKQYDWKKWRLFFCDERCVPYDNSDSTYGYFKKEFFDVVNFPAENVFAIKPSVSVEEAAVDYIEKIRIVYPHSDGGFPSFDLLVLGMGPDGHTCSLFPDHPGLKEQKKTVIAITDSPKPPPARITLTIPVLNAAKNVFVVAAGGSKADAVKACLQPDPDKSPLPAGLARPTNGSLQWFLDPPAAVKLAK